MTILLLDQFGRPIESAEKNQRREMLARLDAAQTTVENRNHWAMADGLSARAAYSSSIRKTVRDRSRYEAGSNSWYGGLLRTVSNHVVGTGPRLQVLTGNPEANARIERVWRSWSASVRLAEKLRVAVETYWRDGEVFARRVSRASQWPLRLDVRLYEADQVSSPFSGAAFDASIEDGIRIDENGNLIEFFIYKRHPGDTSQVNTLDGEWHPASEVLHLYRADRPGQVRGIPRITPALSMFAILRRHTLATLLAAETAANVGMFMKTTSAALTPARSPSDFAEVGFTRNMMTILPEGWEPFQMKPEHPATTHDMFQMRTLMEICRCLNVPYSLACGTSKDANFSAAKMDIRNLWEPEVISEQDRLEAILLDPVWRWFLEAAMFAPGGLLDGMPAIADIDHQWQWDPVPTTDEEVAASAAETRLRTGQSTLPLEYARRGQDFDTAIVRGAQALSVTTDQYKQAIFQSLFGQPVSAIPATTPAAAPASPGGEFGALGRRQLQNNVKAVRDVLQQLIDGSISQVMAGQLLQSLGLSPDRADALISDAIDNAQIDDPSLQEAAA